MACANCGCNKSDHAYTKDNGKGSGQCTKRSHHGICKIYVSKKSENDALDKLKEYF